MSEEPKQTELERALESEERLVALIVLERSENIRLEQIIKDIHNATKPC